MKESLRYLQNAKEILARKFEHLYDTLHIAGYYRGLIHDATLVKESLKAAKEFIDKFK